MNRREFLRATAAGGATALMPAAIRHHEAPVALAQAARVEGAGALHLTSPLALSFDRGAVFQLQPTEHRVRQLRHGAGVEWERELHFPTSVAFADDGTLFVSETGKQRVRALSASGIDRGVVVEGLTSPRGLLLEGPTLFVADAFAHQVVIADRSGRRIGTLGTLGTGHGELNAPLAIAAGADRELHVLDAGNVRVQVFSRQGKPLRSYGGFGDRPGQFRIAAALACDEKRSYVADPALGVVHVFDVQGNFLDRFQPRDVRGRAVAPIRLSWAPGHRLFITTLPATAGA